VGAGIELPGLIPVSWAGTAVSVRLTYVPR